MMEADEVETKYFIDVLFDLINESDELEADLLDLRANKDDLIVTMKDETVFSITVRRGAGRTVEK